MGEMVKIVKDIPEEMNTTNIVTIMGCNEGILLGGFFYFGFVYG